MTTRKLLASLAGVALLASFVALPARADDDKDAKQKVQQDHKVTNPDAAKHNKDQQKNKAKDEAKQAGAEIGKPAPVVSLPDTDGKTVNVADTLQDGKKIVFFVWFNRDCPVIKAHFESSKTFNDLYAKYHEKGVEFFAVCSSGKGNQGYGVEANKEAKKEYEMQYPILLDESGDVGRAYGAKTTPHVFIIAKDGTLAYKGAIDNGNEESGKKTPVNYAAKALDELLAGSAVSTPETKPYGCGVKYAKPKEDNSGHGESDQHKPKTGK